MEETFVWEVEESTITFESSTITNMNLDEDEEDASFDFSSFEIDDETQEPTNILIVKNLNEHEDEHFFRRALEYLNLELITFSKRYRIEGDYQICILVFSNVDDCLEALNRLTLVEILRSESSENQQYKKKEISFGSTTSLTNKMLLLSINNPSNSQLLPPKDERQWLISPPASPPDGWNPIKEDLFTAHPYPDLLPVTTEGEQLVLLHEANGMPKIVVTFD